MEEILVYGVVGAVCLGIIYFYLRKMKQASDVVEAKVEKAKQEGLYEPVSLHPQIDASTCIKSGACVTACPEKDILGIVNGTATLINASHCIGHGACFHACPVEAISLVIGTERRGVELPHVSESFETNVPGIYIAGELGGMGLIKNSVEQGQQAVEHIARSGIKPRTDAYDLIIVGAGPAGISASLTAKKHQINFLTMDQDTLGGTVFTFPRSKIVMTAPMDLPLHGKVKLYDTSKTELLDLWHSVLSKNQIQIREQIKVEAIHKEGDLFVLSTNQGENFRTQRVLLAIGRRGSPRKLNIPGEILEKVAYKLLEPENIQGKHAIVVGGGDSAIESAMLLAEQNTVMLSYRKAAFDRIKPKNKERITAFIQEGRIDMRWSSNLVKIEPDRIELQYEDGHTEQIKNDLVYIFAGGELPTQFLQKAGVEITKRFGYTVKKHK